MMRVEALVSASRDTEVPRRDRVVVMVGKILNMMDVAACNPRSAALGASHAITALCLCAEVPRCHQVAVLL